MKNASLQTRLFACFGLVLVCGVAASAHSVYTEWTLRTQLRDEIDLSSQHLDQARQIVIGLANMRIAMRGVSLFSLDSNLPLAQKARSAFDSTAQAMQQDLSRLQASQSSPEEAAALQVMRPSLERWVQYFPQFADLSMSGHASEADSITIKNISPLMDAIQTNAAALGKLNQARYAAAIAASKATLDRSTVVTFVMTLLVTLAVGIALAVVRRGTRALRRIAQAVGSGAQQVAAASAEISNASQALAQGSSEQAASLEQTAAAAEQVSATAQQNRENSESAAAMVGRSSEKFTSTGDALQGMVQAMGAISSSSDKISRIIKVIDEIAFQTNILALNAAVEAARAGGAGAGFAVVADEVRNLAQRCAQAARDTTALIEESITNSASGKSKVDHVAGSVHEIAEMSGKIKSLVDDVSASSREQAGGMEQIRQAVAQMEQVTQKNAANAEETASAAEELAAQSDSLRDVAGTLTALVGAAHGDISL